MYLGIDLGTSAVKTVLVDDAQRVVASRSRSLTISFAAPRLLRAGSRAVDRGHVCDAGRPEGDHARELAAVEGIGLSGQMHGATLLDAATSRCGPAFSGMTDGPLRNAASWSSAGPPCGRRQATRRCRDSPRPNCCGSPARAGIFAATKLVLQPKAYLRLVLIRRGDRGCLGRLGFAVARCCAPGLVG